MDHQRSLAVFDFDGTLISQDSFFLFSLLAGANIFQTASAFLLAGACKSGILDNAGYKEAVLRQLWLPRNQAQRERVLCDLIVRLRDALRPRVLNRLREHVRCGDSVVVMSASPVFYLRPFMASLLPDVIVVGTTVEYQSSGIMIDNLYGAKKAAAARDLVDELAVASMHVYTDSWADAELMALADQLFLIDPSKNCIGRVRSAGLRYEIFPL